MTKKEFKEKIQAQKESVIKQRDMDRRAFKRCFLACGAFYLIGVASTIAGAITGIEPLAYVGNAFMASSLATAAAYGSEKILSNERHRKDIRSLDKISDDVDDLDNSEEISQ